MKKRIVGFLFGIITFSNVQANFSAELAALYLSQDNDGETFTALPMLGYNVFRQENFELTAKLGLSAYKDAKTDDTFLVGVIHLNPSYKIATTKFSVEAILGAQYWETSETFEMEFGARVNYNISELTKGHMNEIFAGGSMITADEDTLSLTIGLKKNF